MRNTPPSALGQAWQTPTNPEAYCPPETDSMQALNERTLTLSTLLACGLFLGSAQASLTGDDEGYGQPSPADTAKVESLFEEMLAAKAACGDDCSAMCSGECAAWAQEKAAKSAKKKGEYGKKKGESGKYAWDESVARTASYVAKALADKPELWPVLAPIAKERFLAKATSPAHRAVILNMLAAAYSDPARELSGELLAKAPKCFSQDQILMFAERKHGDFVKQIKALTVSNNGKRYDANVRPAAFMAFHGKDLGKRTLTRALKAALKNEALEPADVVDAMVAAAALDELEPADLVRKVQIKIHDAVMGALDSGGIDRARDLALAGKYFAVALEEGQTSLSFLDDKVRLFCMMGSEELGTAEAVFELIEAITPM